MSATEFSALHTGTPFESPNLIGLWEFSEAFGSVARDSSPSGHDGVLGTEDPATAPTWTVSPISIPAPLETGTYQVNFKVVDDDGGFVTASTELTVLNVAPTAQISSSGTTFEVGNLVELSGEASSDLGPGGAQDFVWQVTTESGQVIYDARGVDFSFVPAAPGYFDVTLTVADAQGFQDSQTISIAVAAVARVDLPSTPLVEGQVAELMSSSSTPASPVADREYLWLVQSGIVTVATGFGESLSYLPIDEGVYNVSLFITDSYDGRSPITSLASTTLTVTNAAPTITLPPTAVTNSGTFALPLTVTDPGTEDDVLVSIDWGDGTPIETIVTNGAGLTNLPTHDYAEPGTYGILVTAVDDGMAVSNTSTMILEIANMAPSILEFTGSSQIQDGQAASFTALFSDLATDPHLATWDFGDGSPTVTVAAVADVPLTMDHFYHASGQFTVTLTIIDSQGVTGTASRIVTVNNNAPTLVDFDVVANPLVNESTLISGRIADFESDALRASIDFGDGVEIPVILNVESTDGQLTTYHFETRHTYQVAGTFQVTLRVTDSDGAVMVTSRVVNVSSQDACDFSGDSICDVMDLELLYLEFGSSSPTFDLDGSGLVDNDDLTIWLAQASAADAQGRTFVRGDTNLDGSVGGADFTALASNFGETGGWSQGNFVVDAIPGGGVVGGSDFTALASNFGFVSAANSNSVYSHFFVTGNKGTRQFDPVAVVDEATSPLNSPFQQGPLRRSDSSRRPLRGNKGTQHVRPSSCSGRGDESFE